MGDPVGKCLLCLLAFFLPPLAVWLARGKICSCQVFINIILTLLGWVPGIIHAFIVVCCCSEYEAA